MVLTRKPAHAPNPRPSSEHQASGSGEHALLYGAAARPGLGRYFLHAHRIEFQQPVDVRDGARDPQKDPLSLILADFNQKFGTDWTENDRIQRILFKELPDAVKGDQEYQNAKKNSDRQNARITYDKKLEDKFQEFMFEQTGLYRKFTDDPEFKKWLQDTLFRLDYDAGANAPPGARG